MNISDLSYQETALEANTLEGGILNYLTGSVFAQQIQGVAGYTASGPSGSVAIGEVLDIATLTFGGLNVTF